MAGKTRSHIEELRGATRLAIDATRGVTELVEKMHVTIASGPAMLGRPLATPARLATRAVYASIQGITRLVGSGLDAALGQLAPLIEASPAGAQREAILAVVNGVLGDYLHETANPLEIEMELRPAPDVKPTSKIVVLVHGSCMTDSQFTRFGHDHGAALARDLDYTPVYVRYNSGLHISTNGKALAAHLEKLVATWSVPVEELVLLCHSMGGLVARSACHAAVERGDRWLGLVRALITLGTPHHGAPLERGGNWIDRILGISSYSAPFGALGRIRSAGVTDLRYGNVLDEHWQGRDRFAHAGDPRSSCAMPDAVRLYAIAGTLSTEMSTQLRSDGLVSVDSALGAHPNRDLCLPCPEERRSIVLGTGHMDLLGASVYPIIRDWLAA
jgi:pimeloyl-ACP methyl ester carboxylesterase